MKLRDIDGNVVYPDVLDNSGENIKKSIDNIKNRLTTLESNSGTSDEVKNTINEIITDVDNLENYVNNSIQSLQNSIDTSIQNLQNSTTNSIQDLQNTTNSSIESINSRIDLLESSDVTTELMRPYRGPSNLYVNHNYTGTSDGSSSKPFKSFAELNVYLNQSKIINKSLTINITTSGNYPEALVMSNFSGTGSLRFEFNADGKMQGTDTIYVGINLSHVLLPVIINKFRVFGCSHGILLYDSGYTEVANSIISAKNYGVLYSNTNGYVHDTDFCSSYTPVCAEGGGSTVYCVTLSGNAGASGTGEAFRVLLGGTIYYGTTASTQSIPKGSMNERAGRIFKCGTVIEQASWNYPSSVPDNPTTTMTYSNLYNATSIGTYQYKWSNWVTDACKSGVYSSYGDKAGHLFFDMSSI